MAMNEAERKAAKKAAYLRWYEKKHGRKPAAQGSTPAAKKASKKALPAAKKVAAKKAPAKKALRPQKDPTAAVQKEVDKLVKRGQKTMAQAKAILKEAAGVLADVYRTGDEKFVAKAEAAVCRGLLLQVANSPDERKKSVSAGFGAKLFPVPKKRVPSTKFEKEIAELGIPLPPEEASGSEEAVEVPVDPEVAKKLREEAGSGKAPEWQSSDDEAEPEEDDEQDADEEEDEDEDEEDLTDEEKDERRQRRLEEDEEADLRGREEAMEEVEAMGFGEEDA